MTTIQTPIPVANLLACEPVLRMQLVMAGQAGDIKEIDRITEQIAAVRPKLVRRPSDESKPWAGQWGR